MKIYTGVDLGGTSIKVAAVAEDGSVTAQTQLETRDSIGDTTEKTRYWVQSIREAVDFVATESGGSRVGVGIAAPGLVAADELTIRHMPGRLKGLEGFLWTDALDAGRAVPVMNDAQSALLGESWIGAAAGVENALMLTLGTGVGGALLLGGRVVRGSSGRAGHVGHVTLDLDGSPDICGTPGSLERFVGQATLQERTNGRFETYQELLGRHRAGDPVATELWLRSVRALAAGISSLINVVDPDLVVLGGGISAAPELTDALGAFMDELEWRPDGIPLPIRTAQLGSHGGAIGAARRAMIYHSQRE